VGSIFNDAAAKGERPGGPVEISAFLKYHPPAEVKDYGFIAGDGYNSRNQIFLKLTGSLGSGCDCNRMGAGP